MTEKSTQLALSHALNLCQGHAQPLLEALADLQQAKLSSSDLEHVSKQQRRLLDQFAYRYTRLQDDLGARLMPAVLQALGEDIAPMPMIDRINRLEQLNWLPSAEEWADLRRIRNEFAHDYPESADERYARLQMAMDAATRLLVILDQFATKARERFARSSSVDTNRYIPKS